jgi:hypothetical protein
LPSKPIKVKVIAKKIELMRIVSLENLLLDLKGFSINLQLKYESTIIRTDNIINMG